MAKKSTDKKSTESTESTTPESTESDPRAEALAKLSKTWRALAEHGEPVPGTVCGEVCTMVATFEPEAGGFRFSVMTVDESGEPDGKASGEGESAQQACVALATVLGRSFSDSAPRAFREGLKAAGHDYSANLNTRAPRTESGEGGGSLGIGRKPTKASVSISLGSVAMFALRNPGRIAELNEEYKENPVRGLAAIMAEAGAWCDSDRRNRVAVANLGSDAGRGSGFIEALNQERLRDALAEHDKAREAAEAERAEAREAAEVSKVRKAADKVPDSPRAKRAAAVLSLRGLEMDNSTIAATLLAQGATESEVAQAFADANAGE